MSDGTSTTPVQAPPDLPLPDDWSRRKLVLWSVLGHLALLPIALRHLFAWGGDLAPLLHGLEAAGLIAAVLLMGTAYGRCVRQASSLDLRFLLGSAVLLTALALLVPPFLSSDVFDYVARGRVEYLGHNPYTTTVRELAADPAMGDFAERAQWPDWVMPYGPLLAPVQRLCATLPQPWLAVYAFKILCALAHLAAGWLLYRAAARALGERDGRRALVLWLWNPWLLVESAGSGHNDALQALMLAATVAGVAWLGAVGATASFGFSVLLKHGSAPLFPLLLAWSWWNKKVRGFLLGLAATAAVTALLALIYFRDPGALDFLTRQASVVASSLPALADRCLGSPAGTVVSGLGILLTLLVLAVGCKRAVDGPGFAQAGVLTMAVFLLLAAPNFAPWYHLWWLPLFALCRAPAVWRTVEMLGWLGLLSYLVRVGTHTFGLGHQLWQFALAGLWPVLVLLVEWRQLIGKPKEQ